MKNNLKFDAEFYRSKNIEYFNQVVPTFIINFSQYARFYYKREIYVFHPYFYKMKRIIFLYINKS